MKKNVASQIVGAQMTTAADGTAFTGAVSVLVTIDGGTQTAGGGTAPAHEGNGFHSYTPTQAETNGDHVAFTFTGTGAISSTVQVYPTFPQTGDNFSRLGAPAGASISADIATVDAVADGIQSDLSNGTDGLGAIKAETALILADTNELQTDDVPGLIAALNDIAATDIVSAGAITTLAGAVVNVDLVDTCTTNSDMRGTDSAYTGTPPTAVAIADQVWDETLSGHLGAGSTGNALNAAGSAGDPWATSLPGAYGAGSAGKIIGDNINAPIGTVDTVADAIKAVTDLLPDAGALSSLATASALSTVDTVVDGIQTDLSNATDGLGAIKADTAAILLDTAEIGTAGAGLTSLATAANLATVDTVVDAIKVVTDQQANHVVEGTVGSGSTTTTIVSGLTTAIDQYNGKVITFSTDTTTANLRGQSTSISDTDGSGNLTVVAITDAPVSGDTYIIT